MTRHIADIIASRRALLGGLAGLPLLQLAGCASTDVAGEGGALGFASVPATNADTITLPPGYCWRTLIAWGDALYENMPAFDPDALTRADQERRFGTHCDMIALFPAVHAFPPPRGGDDMIACVNHEFFDPSLMFPALGSPQDITPAHIETALAATGVCVVRLARGPDGWEPVRDTAPGAGLNRRITPFTPVVFSGPAAQHPWIMAAGAAFNAAEAGAPHEPKPSGAIACGAYATCAGGQTPWGTFLSAEENFEHLFAASDAAAPTLREALAAPAFARDCASFSTPRNSIPAALMPARYDMSVNPYATSLYGWTVEIDPYDPNWAPRKRTALGRRSAECATTALTRDGRVAVYSGDDQAGEFVYKFVSRGRFNATDRLANRDLLDQGQLYAARFEEDGAGRWIALTLDSANAAAMAAGYDAQFSDAGDLALRAREAARLLGATPMDRPEDVEAILDSHWVGQGPVLVVCTKNSAATGERPGNPRRPSDAPGAPQPNHAGHILRIDEAGGDCGAEHFSWDVFALCGDPDAEAPTAATRSGRTAFISTVCDGAPTIEGARFACPDNICFDSRQRVWIATDGNDEVFADCNDGVLAAPVTAGPRPVKRFLVGPVGAEICGPALAPDERAFFAAIQHPGEYDLNGVDYADLRWAQNAPPPSSFPNGGWPRSAIVVVTREDGGRIGD